MPFADIISVKVKHPLRQNLRRLDDEGVHCLWKEVFIVSFE
jgi:hypothetical protein